MDLKAGSSRMARIAYVTDLERKIAGGGSYVVNWHAADQLSRRFNTSYVGPIVPTPGPVSVLQSRIRRKVLRKQGEFAYFSPATLDQNARKVAAHLRGDEDALVFRSATRWCRCSTTVPYFIYLDAVFHTFFHNTFEPEQFNSSDIERICAEETAFLENASGVFFESEWGLARAREAYGLAGSHYHVAGRGGSLRPPPMDSWPANSRRLLTVAVDFALKGGQTVLAAFEMLKHRVPDLHWSIVGGHPGVALPPDVVYEGMLDPHDPQEGARLRELFATAWLLVHPTREDTSPLVITEAAYFGCPAISVNAFAIPELVEHEQSGLLLDLPLTPQAVTRAIESLMLDEHRYRHMRQRARGEALRKHAWESVGGRICDSIATALAPKASGER